MKAAARHALDRALEDLEASRHLAGGGFSSQAVSRAYYAAFHSAEAALLALGETRSKHAGVLAAFGRLTMSEDSLDVKTGQILRSLFERRNQADYGGSLVPGATAEEAIQDAELVIRAVESWLSERAE